MIFTGFLHVMVVVSLTFHNVSYVFCFSLQFQALFHMWSNVNMWMCVCVSVCMVYMCVCVYVYVNVCVRLCFFVLSGPDRW